MSVGNMRTPGVFINEVDAFPNSVVEVATAVPAFIGYTPQAHYEGKSYFNAVMKISSFDEFWATYMYPDPPPPADPIQQYSPHYYLVAEDEQPGEGGYMLIDGQYYSIRPDPDTIYYLYNSVRLFYENGGGDAYIVSVGAYGEPGKKPLTNVGDQIVNANVKLADLQRGLALLKKEPEPTLYICPEATLLDVAENGTLMQSMLLQAEDMQTAMCIFDIIGGRNPDPISYTEDIQAFRTNTGTTGLQYGAAYYPFVDTTLMQSNDIDFTNLFAGDLKQLAALINPPSDPNPTAAKLLNWIENPPETPLTHAQYHNALSVASKTYKQIIQHVLHEVNIMPPSGGMAGVYTVIDNSVGVWKAPANTAIVGVTDVPIRLSDDQQSDLNVDVFAGKSINAIRFFNGLGILVWGARTLDGNSQDWRYISVRRTMTMLEQSCKLAAQAYVFEPNDRSTWEAVKAMISSFLTNIWKQGGLQGAVAADAFEVSVGLGSTMTAEDILSGVMRVSVKVAVVRPAEFIVFTFEQQMAKS